jgi:hypothetical protein
MPKNKQCKFFEWAEGFDWIWHFEEIILVFWKVYSRLCDVIDEVLTWY